MKASEAKRLRELEAENARLKRLVANQALDIDMLKELAEQNFWPRSFFAWLANFRRLVRDYETLPATHQAMIWTAATWQLSNRLTR
jgi:putative transposase